MAEEVRLMQQKEKARDNKKAWDISKSLYWRIPAWPLISYVMYSISYHLTKTEQIPAAEKSKVFK